MQLSENSKNLKHASLRHFSSKRGKVILAVCLVLIAGTLFMSRNFIGRNVSHIYSLLTNSSDSEENTTVNLTPGDTQNTTQQSIQADEYESVPSGPEESTPEDQNVETEYTENFTGIATPSAQENNTLRDADTE